MHRPTTLMTLLALGAIALSMPACAQTSPPTSLDYHVSAVPASIRALSWQLLLEDPEGDGAGINEADGQALFYAYDAEADSLWFRFDLYKGFNEERPAMSLSFDLDGDPENGVPWYGTNRAFMVDAMVSVGLLARQGDRWGGYNGITDAEGIRTSNWINVKKGIAVLYIDSVSESYYVGLSRSDLGSMADTVRLIGSVGMNAWWNDDIGDTGSATLSF